MVKTMEARHRNLEASLASEKEKVLAIEGELAAIKLELEAALAEMDEKEVELGFTRV